MSGPEAIFDAIREQRVTHFCAAPIVLNMLNNAPPALKEGIAHQVRVMTAGSAPPAPVIEGMERMGFEVTQVYGLTETYGPSRRVRLARGVEREAARGKSAAEGATGRALPHARRPDGGRSRHDGARAARRRDHGRDHDARQPGHEGLPQEPDRHRCDFAGGWLHSGDLAVWHADGYVEIKDRSKDIIISGGENISSLEVEEVLYRHPAVLEAAVVARPDAKWGETPCAFVTLKEGAVATEDELILFCREQMARFKVPRTVVLGPLPKTATGKVQKFELRDQAKALGSLS